MKKRRMVLLYSLLLVLYLLPLLLAEKRPSHVAEQFVSFDNALMPQFKQNQMLNALHNPMDYITSTRGNNNIYTKRIKEQYEKNNDNNYIAITAKGSLLSIELTCSNQQLHIQCPNPKQVIQINSMSYGRILANNTLCSNDNIVSTECIGNSIDVSDQISTQCNGNEECKLMISCDTFRVPYSSCLDMYGYLSGTYYCIHTKTQEQRRKIKYSPTKNNNNNQNNDNSNHHHHLFEKQAVTSPSTTDVFSCYDSGFNNGRVVILTAENGQIMDKLDTWSGYGSDWNCNFLISPQVNNNINDTSLYVIHIFFDRFDLENDTGGCTDCTCDYMNVYDGMDNTAPLLGSQSFCGTKSDGIAFRSSGKYMYISFSSDSYVSGLGFRATYETIVAPSGTIQFVSSNNNIIFNENERNVTMAQLGCSNCTLNEQDVSVDVTSYDNTAIYNVHYKNINDNIIFNDPLYDIIGTILQQNSTTSRKSKEFNLTLSNPSITGIVHDANTIYPWSFPYTQPSNEHLIYMPLWPSSSIITLDAYTAYIEFEQVAMNVTDVDKYVWIIVTCFHCENVTVSGFIHTEYSISDSISTRAYPYFDFTPLEYGMSVTFDDNDKIDQDGYKRKSIDIKLLNNLQERNRRQFDVTISNKGCPLNLFYGSCNNNDYINILNDNITAVLDDTITINILPTATCGEGTIVQANRTQYYCLDNYVTLNEYETNLNTIAEQIQGQNNTITIELLCNETNITTNSNGTIYINTINVNCTNNTLNTTVPNTYIPAHSNCSYIFNSIIEYFPLTSTLNITDVCYNVINNNDTSILSNLYNNINWDKILYYHIWNGNTYINYTVYNDIYQYCNNWNNLTCSAGCYSISDAITLCACPYDKYGPVCEYQVDKTCEYMTGPIPSSSSSIFSDASNDKAIQKQHNDKLYSPGKPKISIDINKMIKDNNNNNTDDDENIMNTPFSMICGFTKSVYEGIDPNIVQTSINNGYTWDDDIWRILGFNYSVFITGTDVLIPSSSTNYINNISTPFNRGFALTLHTPLSFKILLNNYRRITKTKEIVTSLNPSSLMNIGNNKPVIYVNIPFYKYDSSYYSGGRFHITAFIAGLEGLDQLSNSMFIEVKNWVKPGAKDESVDVTVLIIIFSLIGLVGVGCAMWYYNRKKERERKEFFKNSFTN